jgi:hypothetical protein
MDPEAIARQVEERVNARWMQQTQQRSQHEGAQAVEQFQATNPEFLDDVRQGMAVRMEMAAKAGRAVTLQEAYDSECWANPDVRTILQKRQQAEAAKAQTASTQQARIAASSVKSNPSTGASSNGASKANGSYRDMVAAAWDTLEGR